MTVNRKTRNKSNAARYAKAKRTKRIAAEYELFGEELEHAVAGPVTAAPTSAVYRMVGTGHDGTGHRGAEVAKMLATGQANVTLRNKDAAGPLKESVGLTTQRGGATDYLRNRSSRMENTQPLSIDAQGIRATDIAGYDTRNHGA